MQKSQSGTINNEHCQSEQCRIHVLHHAKSGHTPTQCFENAWADNNHSNIFLHQTPTKCNPPANWMELGQNTATSRTRHVKIQ